MNRVLELLCSESHSSLYPEPPTSCRLLCSVVRVGQLRVQPWDTPANTGDRHRPGGAGSLTELWSVEGGWRTTLAVAVLGVQASHLCAPFHPCS